MPHYVKNLPIDEPEPPNFGRRDRKKRGRRRERRPYRHLLDGLPIRSLRWRAELEDGRALRASPGRWVLVAGVWATLGLMVLARRPEPVVVSFFPGLVAAVMAYVAAFMRSPLVRAGASVVLLAAAVIWLAAGLALVVGIPGVVFSTGLLLGSLLPAHRDPVA